MYNIGDKFSTPYPNRGFKIIDRDLSGVYQYKIEYDDDRTRQNVGDVFLDSCLQRGIKMLEVGTKLVNSRGVEGTIVDVDKNRPNGHPYMVQWFDRLDKDYYTDEYIQKHLKNSVKSKVGCLEYKFWVCYSESLGFEVLTDYGMCEKRVEELAKQGTPAVMLESTKVCFPKGVEWKETKDVPF